MAALGVVAGDAGLGGKGRFAAPGMAGRAVEGRGACPESRQTGARLGEALERPRSACPGGGGAAAPDVCIASRAPPAAGKQLCYGSTIPPLFYRLLCDFYG